MPNTAVFRFIKSFPKPVEYDFGDGVILRYYKVDEMELEARADEMIENDYKDYLKKMLQRFPNRAAVREQFPEEYNAMPYLEDLFPEEY